jgi:4-amino-4-deoxychorismate lyase
MFSFLETICVQNGQALHLDFHQLRVNETFEQYFPAWKAFEVAAEIDKISLPSTGTHRLRLIYAADPVSLEILPYVEKPIKTFKLVESGEIDYGSKWADREFFQAILAAHPEADEVIFTKDGKIQDCTIANLAFLKDGIWYTPDDPMHWGTTRARLIIQEELEETDIFIEDLDQYERICMINVFRPLSYEHAIALPEAIV